MKGLFILLIFVSLQSCGQSGKQTATQTTPSMELYNRFDKDNHLQPLFKKASFDKLHDWEFGWAMLEPINIAKGAADEKKLARRFSPGQKALYFFWYLDAEVTNGGFIQFFWNYKQQYLPPINEGLKLIGDTAMLDLVSKAEKEYEKHKEKFTKQEQKDDWSPLYDELKNFDKFDSIYYTLHDKTMKLIEQYARQHPAEFVRFK